MCAISEEDVALPIDIGSKLNDGDHMVGRCVIRSSPRHEEPHRRDDEPWKGFSIFEFNSPKNEYTKLNGS